MKKKLSLLVLLATSAFAECGWGEVQVCTWVDCYPFFYGFWACECQNNVWPIANVEKKNSSFQGYGIPGTTYSVFLPTNLTPEETEKALQSVQSKFVKKAEKKEPEKKLKLKLEFK